MPQLELNTYVHTFVVNTFVVKVHSILEIHTGKIYTILTWLTNQLNSQISPGQLPTPVICIDHVALKVTMLTVIITDLHLQMCFQ